MTKMFCEVRRTYNPVVGCEHGCSYCWARELALGRLKHLPRYRDGFKPKLIDSELGRRFAKGLVFVSDMGDMWGEWVPKEWILAVLEAIRQSPNATFLFLTKNSARYHEFLDYMPPNVILGTTIETNRPTTQFVSRAPITYLRQYSMRGIPDSFRKMVSIEPIMDFDHHSMVSMVSKIRPEFVYVGLDNWNHHLPEPTLEKTEALIEALRKFTEVRVKTLREAWWVEQ